MNTAARHERLLEMLGTNGCLAVKELSDAFSVSEMTIRRDLAQLEKDGLLRRTHGGAEPAHGTLSVPSHALRTRLMTEAKQAIAEGIAAELQDGQTVVLDGGTTGLAIARALAGRHLTVCTLSMRCAEVLMSSPNCRVLTPGGWLRRDELSFGGPDAVRALIGYRFDTYLMTVAGLDVDAGLTEWTVEDAEMKRAALEVSARCVVACDSAKFGRTAFVRLAALESADLVVTDAGVDPRHCAAVRSAGVELRLC